MNSKAAERQLVDGATVEVDSMCFDGVVWRRKSKNELSEEGFRKHEILNSVYSAEETRALTT